VADETTRRDFLLLTAATVARPRPTAAQQTEVPHEHSTVPSDPTLRVKALESVLVEKGLVDPQALDALIDTFEHTVGPRDGARVIARAWVDPAYKKRLLTDASAAIAALGALVTRDAMVGVAKVSVTPSGGRA
jgi:hypothetical protein